MRRQDVDLRGGGPPHTLSRSQLVWNKQSVVPEPRGWEPDKHCPAPPAREPAMLSVLPCLFFQSAGRGFLLSSGRRAGAPGRAHSPAGSTSAAHGRASCLLPPPIRAARRPQPHLCPSFHPHHVRLWGTPCVTPRMREAQARAEVRAEQFPRPYLVPRWASLTVPAAVGRGGHPCGRCRDAEPSGLQRTGRHGSEAGGVRGPGPGGTVSGCVLDRRVTGHRIQAVVRRKGRQRRGEAPSLGPWELVLAGSERGAAQMPWGCASLTLHGPLPPLPTRRSGLPRPRT